MADLDVVVYAHRRHEMQDVAERSIRETCGLDFEFHLVIEKDTAHANANRALRCGTAQYVCLLDEDIEMLTPNWDMLLVDVMRRDPRIGGVNCHEVKTLEERAQWLAKRGPIGIVDLPWMPAYVTLIDRERTPWYRWDERMPGRKGMSDVDASMLLRDRGFRCVRHLGVCVYHPHKGSEAERLAIDTTTKAEELACFGAQQQYMIDKWGLDFYRKTIEEASSFMPQAPTFEKPAWFQ